ncbi:MAG: aldo/keto reductase [Pseudanabaenaceae cyanobacterium SKYGB_i_bin29]|nr:aldo/keto reductase [Pseudanabaenaceae cyanobacterium SKYG29]MDW8421208.1 aldo/keto reductase [Pseudanabaenaceae cyanobacterium SKYGB_i_bin29]
MEYRELGKTGVKVSVLCLGTMTWGRQNTEAEGHAQMDYALDRGINFWDTAELYAIPPTADTYGKTETIIGTWFASRKKRDQVILATKIAGPGLSWIRNGEKYDRRNIFLAVEGSLKRLQTDYIDLYQLHWPNRGSYHFSRHWQYAPQFDRSEVEANMIEVLQALQDLIQQGKIRFIGLSNETAWGTMTYLHLAEKLNLPRVVSIQNEYSLLCRLFEPDLHEIAVTEKVGLLAWSPLATGMLTGKYLDGQRPPGSRWTLPGNMNSHRNTKQANSAVHAYKAVAAKHGLSLPQMALAFVRRQPFVTAAIIGATTMDQLRHNIDSIGVELSPDVLADIEAVRRDYPMPY